MRYLIFFVFSLFLFLFSIFYIDDPRTTDGEYQSSWYYIGAVATGVNIITNVRGNDFLSHSYVSSPSLNETAVFLSKGSFLDSSPNGDYRISYIMEEKNSPSVLRPNNSLIYFDMVGRVGVPLEEEIKSIYKDEAVSIFDMKRNKNFIMYKKSH